LRLDCRRRLEGLRELPHLAADHRITRLRIRLDVNEALAAVALAE
jgi:hypothetical protein